MSPYGDIINVARHVRNCADQGMIGEKSPLRTQLSLPGGKEFERLALPFVVDHYSWFLGFGTQPR